MKLSIITVNLNNLEGLKKTYDSVVCQTFTDYEWLLSDGGSPEGSREFIEQHQDKFAYWCSESDKGIYNAMNKGIVRAKGEYLNFMNSGDSFVSKEILEVVFSKQCTADIFYGIQLVDSHGRLIPANIHQKSYWYDLFYDSLPHQASFIRYSLFSSVGLYDESYRIISDWKWFIQAILIHGASCEFLPIVISFFAGNGISSTNLITLEKKKFKMELFLRNISDEDRKILTKISFIRSFKLTYLLFKLLGIIAWRTDSFIQKYFTRY